MDFVLKMLHSVLALSRRDSYLPRWMGIVPRFQYFNRRTFIDFCFLA